MRDHDVLLIVGKGETWRDDLARFLAMGVPHDVLGVNQAALWLDPAPKHAFSYHPDIMDEVKRQRPEIVTHAARPSGGVDHVWRIHGETGGSSSYLACRVALDFLGYSKIVLAGVPLSGQYLHDFFQQWINGVGYLSGRVKSFSGATYSLLGEPTTEWLNA